MSCPNCKKDTDKGQNICPNCGAKLDNKKTISSKEVKMNIKKVKTIDEEYLDIFLGKEKENVKNDNYCYACLFGPAYALYCNMWKIGFVWLLIEGLSLYFIPLKFSIIILIALNIIIGFIYNEWYLNESKKQIIIIKNKMTKPKDIKEECLKRGKKSTTMLILSIIIYILLILIICFKNGVRKEIDNLKLNIPIDFIDETSYSTYRGYKYVNEKDSCYIDITSFDPGKQTAKNYLNSQTHEDGSEISGLETEEINGKKWYRVEEITSKGYKLYYYAISEKGRIYSVKYSIYKDSGLCSNNKDKLVKSLRF